MTAIKKSETECDIYAEIPKKIKFFKYLDLFRISAQIVPLSPSTGVNGIESCTETP